MSRQFHINTSDLIEEVRLRECLWKTSDPLYKNRDARVKAWDEIVTALFENVSAQEKQHLEKLIQQRWKTARDAFFRSRATMNAASGSSAKKIKKYIFFDELTFLTPPEETEANESLNEQPENVENEECSSPIIINVSGNDSLPSSSTVTRKDHKRPLGKKIRPHKVNEKSKFETTLLSLLDKQTPDIASDDLSFFYSLGPILKGFNVEQKLEFRTRVLNVVSVVRNMANLQNSADSAPISIVKRSPQYEDATPDDNFYESDIA